jgi:hypothetical protein
MTKEALRLALEALKEIIHWYAVRDRNDVLLNFVDQNPEIKKAMKAITVIEAALEAKDEPYAFEASMYPRVIIDPVTGNVSIGTVTKACGLECDCTDVCEQETDYKALWQQMCERCDELDKKLAQRPSRSDITWAGLDVEDYIKALELCDFDKDAAFEFFEAKLKDKNS